MTHSYSCCSPASSRRLLVTYVERFFRRENKEPCPGRREKARERLLTAIRVRRQVVAVVAKAAHQ